MAGSQIEAVQELLARVQSRSTAARSDASDTTKSRTSDIISKIREKTLLKTYVREATVHYTRFSYG